MRARCRPRRTRPAEDRLVTVWKSGRGALGVLKPLLGRWATETEGPSNFGTIRVTRRFETVLGGAWVRLDVLWALGGGKTYEEIALFGKGEDGALAFTSFTSDGKQARGAAPAIVSRSRTGPGRAGTASCGTIISPLNRAPPSRFSTSPARRGPRRTSCGRAPVRIDCGTSSPPRSNSCR